MLTYHILEDDNILIVEPKGPLSKDDFGQLTADVDLHLARSESLRGLLVHATAFPGWENFGAMVSHFRFVRDHHRRIEKVALASDSPLSVIVPKLAAHFVNAEVRHFAFDERNAAIDWLKSGGK